jgi:hypothetical protein
MLVKRLTKCHSASFKLQRLWDRNKQGRRVNPVLVCVCVDCGRIASLTEKTRSAFVPDIWQTFPKVLINKMMLSKDFTYTQTLKSLLPLLPFIEDNKRNKRNKHNKDNKDFIDYEGR